MANVLRPSYLVPDEVRIEFTQLATYMRGELDKNPPKDPETRMHLYKIQCAVWRASQIMGLDNVDVPRRPRQIPEPTAGPSSDK